MKFLKLFFVFVFLFPMSGLAMEHPSSDEVKANSSKTPKIQKSDDSSEKATSMKKNLKKKNTKEEKADVTKSSKKKKRKKKRNVTLEPIKSLVQDIEIIQAKIEESHQKASARKVFEGYTLFQALEYEETEWESLAHALKAYKWPSQQTWREVLGGHLFFPEDTVDWAEESETQYNRHWARRNDTNGYLLTRIDYLWAFVIGAKFNHPVSTFYLGKMGEEVWKNYNFGVFINFFKKFRQKALKDLEKCTDSPDARYVLAHSGNYTDEEAYQFCLQGSTRRDLYNALLIKDYVSRYQTKRPTEIFNNPPKAQSFYDLALEHKYGPPYIKTALLVSSSQAITLLTRLGKGGYNPAWLRLGDCFLEEANVTKAREYYLKAAESGISQGYIKLANTYVGNRLHEAPFEYPKKKFKEISQEDFDKAVNYFNLAAQAKNQEGIEHLVTLYLDVHEYGKPLSETLPEQEKTKSEITRHWDDHDVATAIFLGTSKDRLKAGSYDKEISAALKQGIKMGSARCYQWAASFYEEDAFWQLLKKYGFTPQCRNFREEVKKFLKKDAYLPPFTTHEKPVHKEGRKGRSKKDIKSHDEKKE